MVGPDYHAPAAPDTDSYTTKLLPKKTVAIHGIGSAGKAQYYDFGEDIPAEWWSLYHSPELNQLIRLGLKNSPNLAAALAALRQAQETYSAQFASSLIPAVSVQPNGLRQRFSDATFGVPGGLSSAPNIFNLYNVTVNVSYTLDAFGGLRRQLEALRDQVDYTGLQLEAAYLTLTANIVTTAIMGASFQAQIQATQELIRSQQEQLNIVKKQYNLGASSGADVFAQESQLAQTQATLPPLEQNFARTQHALSVLTGVLPSEAHLPALSLKKFTLPAHLPVSLPSSLVRQRPDILASEALLMAACAQVGVATANLYPQITLTGTYGWTSDSLGGIFARSNLIWSYGGSLVQPIFNGGALRAKKRAAVDAFEQAAAQYRQTVLVAFQNVADTLQALDNDARQLKARVAAETAAQNSLAITQRQYKLGGVSYVSLLTAQRQYQQTRIGRIQAEAARYTDTAGLFQALGGGWWNHQWEWAAHGK